MDVHVCVAISWLRDVDAVGARGGRAGGLNEEVRKLRFDGGETVPAMKKAREKSLYVVCREILPFTLLGVP